MVRKKAKGLTQSQSAIASVRRDPERYAPLGLTANPFPAGGLAPSNPLIEPFPDVRSKIVSFLTQFLETGSSNGLVLLGNYGAGKTYHLNYIRSLLKSATYSLKIVHVVDPGLHPYQIIRSILLNIGEEEVATMIWGVIGPYLKKQHDENPNFFDGMVSRTKGKSVSTAIGQSMLRMAFASFTEETWSDHRIFLKELERQILIDRERLVYEITPSLTNRSSSMYISDIKQIVQDLIGVCLYDGVPALERWKAMTEGVGAGAIQPGNEPQFLTALLHLLKKSGVEYFILLVDEFEKVPQLERMTDKDARLYLDTLRMLIDEGHQHLPFAYVVASNPDAWRIAVDKIAPLKDRFTAIDIPPMVEDKAALHMIRSYLAEARTDVVYDNNPLSPFPPNFLELIPADARRTARQLVKLCHALIEQAVMRGWSTVEPDLIDELLRDQDDATSH